MFSSIPVVPILITILVIALIGVIMSGYVKAPPDMAFIISGFKKEPKVLIGTAGIKIPFLERKDTLLLKQISIDIKTNGFVPTQDFIGVDIDAVAKIKINTDTEGINLAMKNFLNMTEKEIVDALTDSLQGNMREIIGTVTLRELNTDRKKFGDEMQAKAQTDMNALGIEIISCNIQRIEDEQNLITALGQDNMSQIQKSASIAKAQAERDIAIASAQAAKEANDAKVASEQAIAEQQNALAIKKAELRRQADEQKAIADAAYTIQQEEQRKTVEAKTAEANLVKQEKEIELTKRQAEIEEQKLNASIRKQAEANKYAEQQRAEADLIKRQKEAEARRYEMEQEAEAVKVKAEADKFAAEQKAEAIRLQGLAEAESIKAKSVAEAEGIEKKAEAMAKMGEAAVLEMFFNAWPEAVKNAATPLEQVDKITMYGDGNNAKLVKDIVNISSQVMDGLKTSTGLDLKDLVSKFTGKSENEVPADFTTQLQTIASSLGLTDEK